MTRPNRLLFYCCSLVLSLLTSGCREQASTSAVSEINPETLGEALAILKQEEKFTRFFETEKRGIRNPTDEAYLKARNTYLIYCYTTGRRQQAPGQALQQMEDWLKSNKAAHAKHLQALEDAFWLAGMELLTDRPALPYEEQGLLIRRNLVYAEQPNKQVRLDLFLPDGKKPDSASLPCIICIHGGGFRVHRREWFAGHAAAFAKAGFAAVTIDYRKEPGIESRLDSVLDAKAAVRWVRANAADYGIDPDKIGVFGGSAGAFLTNSLATTADVKELENSGGNIGVSCAVQAAVSCAGGCMRLDPPDGREPNEGLRVAIERYGREMMEKFSPYQQIDATDPPILILHGDLDRVVPLWETEDLSSRYQTVGLSPQYEILKGKGHSFYLSQETADRAIRFFQSIFL